MLCSIKKTAKRTKNSWQTHYSTLFNWVGTEKIIYEKNTHELDNLGIDAGSFPPVTSC